MRNIQSTPKKDGFRMPGEFEPRKQDFLIWPERQDTWRMGGKPAQAVLVEVAREIIKHEPLTVFCSASQYENARARLPEEVRVAEMTIDDAWAQDKGPCYVVNDKGEMRGVSWGWNAYGGLEGGLYFPWNRDQEFSEKLAQFGLTFSDVADNCPRQERTFAACRRVLDFARTQPELLKRVEDTGKLPMGELSAGSGTDKKTMERHRKYLVAILLAFTNGYEIIRGHLCQVGPKKGGDEA